jgi:hypothetical protein
MSGVGVTIDDKTQNILSAPIEFMAFLSFGVAQLIW